jgi:hypothetical protein
MQTSDFGFGGVGSGLFGLSSGLLNLGALLSRFVRR